MIKFSKELEAGILGQCILSKTAFGRTYGLIDETKFYYQANQVVYAAMKAMYNLSIPIDLITLYIYMQENKFEIDYPDPAWYLSQLTNSVVDAVNLEYHCYLLKNFWQKRELEKITRSGIDLAGDIRKQGYSLNEQISKILDSERKKEWYSMDELMYLLIVRQQKIKSGEQVFITSGFNAIDRLNGGFSPGNVIIIGARPSVGKSALMGKMATAIARQGKKVGIISLEMNNTEIAGRLASLETDIDFKTIYQNLFKDESQHEQFYNKISRETINLPIYVSDKTKVDINEIKAKAAKLKAKHGLDLLMIDYLQLVESTHENKNYNREQEMSKISRGVKILAGELQIPIIELCQLNRAVTARKGKERFPMLSDLRETGSLEQDADIVLMLHRDWMSGIEEDEHGNTTENQANLLAVKWRNGATFKLDLNFDPHKMKFYEKSNKPAGNWKPVAEVGDLFENRTRKDLD